MNPAWYLRRLRRMEPSELAGRVNDQMLRQLWRIAPPDVARRTGTRLAPGARQPRLKPLPSPDCAPRQAAERLIESANRILAGHWRIFARDHDALGERPDWFVDVRSGKRAPAGAYAFAVPYRDEAAVGNIKYIWEPSRHHHLTVLASAYYLTSDERYASRVAEHLTSWWRENPFPCGPHWISGIELGVRLISWAWVRQLLQGWPGAPALFEDNDQFLTQLYAHQYWLSQFPSRGSSANNHIIAEAAGQFVAACVFPFFRDSARWRAQSAATLAHEAVAQTLGCGSNAELATDYHGFVLELLLAAAVQGEASGHPLDDAVWTTMCRMSDVIAAMLDDRAHPPRQGDGDDGIGLLLDDHAGNRWLGLLATGARLFGDLPWWPSLPESDLRSFVLTDGIAARAIAGRPARRPHVLAGAGQAFLVDAERAVWCRCDHGPHGFGRIAAHAHADALSLECRIGGVDVLADPGTYCYHGDPRWRAYFRSTLGHNTLCLFARDQSVSGGPFLWTRHAQSRLIATSGLDDRDADASWIAAHTGYQDEAGLVHRRSVQLQRQASRLVVTDIVLGHEGLGDEGLAVPARLSWHLGSEVECKLDGRTAQLAWPGGHGELDLPAALSWTSYRGDEAVPAGWYSPSFDLKVPATTLIGSGTLAAGQSLVTELRWSRDLAPRS
ncbi:alginate lyase family protein [Bradyrhizobium tropiciagri]|uniref:heparinase II/III family protein n=1 Tax=Bradyrhizobium tropiciagri TaxID=312253 RepID=UPI001BAA4824|nr:alginate lyase family protein [Bradyrhizobium tropiciagri]MBR0898194.1 alginate lyase family protein [Bradyrhizobium tropiciagri]